MKLGLVRELPQWRAVTPPDALDLPRIGLEWGGASLDLQILFRVLSHIPGRFFCFALAEPAHRPLFRRSLFMFC